MVARAALVLLGLCALTTAPVSADDSGPKVVFSLKQNAAPNSADAARRQVLAARRGDVITVALQSGPGSGHAWKLVSRVSTDIGGDSLASVKTADVGALQELADEHAMEPFARRHIKLGQTSHQLFKFKATAAGNTNLRFEYARPFDPASTAPADAVVVEVRAAERVHAGAGEEEEHAVMEEDTGASDAVVQEAEKMAPGRHLLGETAGPPPKEDFVEAEINLHDEHHHQTMTPDKLRALQTLHIPLPNLHPELTDTSEHSPTAEEVTTYELEVLEGDSFMISLQGAPAAGYEWGVSQVVSTDYRDPAGPVLTGDEAAVKQISAAAVPRANEGVLPGQEGFLAHMFTYEFVFRAVEATDSCIVSLLYRPPEQVPAQAEEPLHAVEVKVVVRSARQIAEEEERVRVAAEAEEQERVARERQAEEEAAQAARAAQLQQREAEKRRLREAAVAKAEAEADAADRAAKIHGLSSYAPSQEL